MRLSEELSGVAVSDLVFEGLVLGGRTSLDRHTPLYPLSITFDMGLCYKAAYFAPLEVGSFQFEFHQRLWHLGQM